VTIPDSVTTLGGNAFFNCTGLTDVSIGSGISAIAQSAFQGTGLTSVTIPTTITAIGDFAFFGCADLAEVSLGGGVTSIGQGAFQACPSLISISIPSSVTSLGGFAFGGSDSMNDIYFLGDAPTATSNTFDGQTGLNVFYLPGTSGWTNPWNGRSTAAWNPVASAPGLQAGQFGFTVSGSGDFRCIVEGSDDLVEWTVLETLTLSGGSATFNDPDTSLYPARFYRFRVPGSETGD
jgi:hypothetical protein